MNPTSDMAINVTNQIAVTRVVAITGVSAMLALIQVPELRAALFHSLMFLSMVVALLIALFTRAPFHGPSISRWDEAAAFLLLAIGAGAFVDHEALAALAWEESAAGS